MREGEEETNDRSTITRKSSLLAQWSFGGSLHEQGQHGGSEIMTKPLEHSWAQKHRSPGSLSRAGRQLGRWENSPPALVAITLEKSLVNLGNFSLARHIMFVYFWSFMSIPHPSFLERMYM